jgi:FMN hydrolase / 5-amino-6-(5-phospho-D-ribitylamino)uracil phosphatase
MGKNHIEAVVLDLDDTLWPIAPVINRAEKALARWIVDNAPTVAAQWDVNTLKLLRASLVAANPRLKNDVMGLRRGTIAAAFADAGAPPEQAEEAFEFFRGERQKVEFYPDAMPALERLRRRYRLGVISNGFADVNAIGIGGHFDAVVSAHEVGISKPDPRIFEAFVERMGLAPGAMIYVGDDPANDVLAPQAAGFHSAWINRAGHTWPEDMNPAGAPAPAFSHLGEFADWLLEV